MSTVVLSEPGSISLQLEHERVVVGCALPFAVRRLSLQHPITAANLERLTAPALTVGLSTLVLGKSSRSREWSPATVKTAWSHLKTGLAVAMKEELPEDERSMQRGRWVLAEGWTTRDLRPLLTRVPECAASVCSSAESKGAARRSARLLLRVLVTGLAATAPVAARTWVLSAPWRELIAAVAAVGTPRAKKLLTGLMNLGTVACSDGKTSPADLPKTGAEFRSWLATQPLRRWQRIDARWACAAARALGLPETSLLPPLSRSWANKRLADGTKEHWAKVQRWAPSMATHARTWEQALAKTAAKPAEQLVKAKKGSVRQLAPATEYARRRALERTAGYAALAVQHGVVPKELGLPTATVLDWHTTMVPCALIQDVFDPEHEDSVSASLGLSPMCRDVEATGVPAIAAAMLWAAEQGHITSHGGPAEWGASPSLSSLPGAVVTNLQMLWQTVVQVARSADRVNGASMERHPRLRIAAEAHQAITRHLGAARDEESLSVKDKKQLVAMVTVPWLLALMIPWWTLVELPRRRDRLRQIRERLAEINANAPLHARWADGEHPAEREAASEYCKGLEEWACVAIFTADPIRVKNHFAARLGTGAARSEISVVGRWSSDGERVSLQGVSATYGGLRWATAQGNTPATLKDRFRSERPFAWAAVAVDMQWFGEYLQSAWLPAIHRRYPAAAQLTLRAALESGDYALFVTDGGTQRKRETSAPVAGAYSSENGVRQRFARGMLAMLRAIGAEEEGLTRGPVPATPRDAARVWPFLMTPHPVRLAWATHLVGILGDGGAYLRRRVANGEIELVSPTAHAVRATTDTEATLRTEYMCVKADVDLARDRSADSWRHPRAYDVLVDLLVAVDQRPDLAALWDAWAATPEDPATSMMPVSLRKAWARRKAGSDLDVPALRRKSS